MNVHTAAEARWPFSGGGSPTPTRGPLPFERYQPRDGDPDWGRLLQDADAIVDEVQPGLGLPSGAWRRRLAAYRTTTRNYVHNQRLHRQGREDFRPLYFIWTLLRTCNFRCTYCDDHQGRKYPDLPNDGVLSTDDGKALLEVMRTRTPSVYFAGGEPLARADLPVLAEHAQRLDYYPIVVNTNASLVTKRLRSPAWRDWLAQTDMIVVSLDALNLATLEDMWAFKKPATVLRDLLVLWRLADAMQFKLMVNMVIQPGRVAEASAVVDFANDLGLWLCAVPVNIAGDVDGSLFADPEYPALVQKILARKAQGLPISGSARMIDRLLRGAPFQCRNTLKPHVDFDGRLLWPCKATTNVEPAYLRVLDYDDLDDLYRAGRRRIDPTGFHGLGPDQCGANCNWAQNYTTDLYVHGLEHPASLVRDVIAFTRR